MNSVPERKLKLSELFGCEQPVALVTGSGAPRVGRVVARHLANAGYRVVLHADRSVEKAVETCKSWQAEGLAVSMVQGSIEDESAIRGWVEHIHAELGGLHVVVNTAAVWEPTPLETLDARSVERQWRINLLGPMLLARAAGLHMTGRPHGGVIVNIGDAAIGKPYCDFAAYQLSKCAIPDMTRIMATELAARNPRVRVNAVLPGPVLLDDSLSDAKREKIVDQTLLKRCGSADDVATAVLYLCEAPFVTGTILTVDGGRNFHDPNKDETLAHPTYQPRKIRPE